MKQKHRVAGAFLLLFLCSDPSSAAESQPADSPKNDTEESAKAGSRRNAQGEEASDVSLQAVTVYGRRAEDTQTNIPQSVTVFQPEEIEMTSATTVGDLVRFVPTASRNGSTLNAFGDDYLIRGFAVSQTINGLGFNRVAHPRDLANVERIEILKGPASVLYGQMEPGAVINVVTKQPLDEYHASFNTGFGSDVYRRISADVTGPLADGVSGRLNVAWQNSDSFIDFWNLERQFLAPNVRIDIGSNTSLSLEGAWSRNRWGSFQNGRPAYGDFLPNPNGSYDQSFNPDEPDIGYTRRDSMYGNVAQ